VRLRNHSWGFNVPSDYLSGKDDAEGCPYRMQSQRRWWDQEHWVTDRKPTSPRCLASRSRTPEKHGRYSCLSLKRRSESSKMSSMFEEVGKWAM